MDKPIDKVRDHRLDEVLNTSVNFHKRRITNASDPIGNQDYVTKFYVDSEIDASIRAVGLNVDTDIPGPPLNLAVHTNADNDNIPGNGFEVLFYWPVTQVFSGDAYWVLIHDTGTMPSVTTFDTGTAGAIKAGINRLTDLTKSFTPNALVNKDILIFSNKRGGTPTHDLEGLLIFAPILSNTATEITFGIQRDLPHTLTNIEYYIVDPNAGNHVHEKLKFVHFSGFNERPDTALRRVRFTNGTGALFFWVMFTNVWGIGEINDPAVTETFTGITSGEIATDAIIESKILDAAITELKIAAQAVTRTRVALAAIDTAQLEDLAVNGDKIAAASVTAAHIVAGTITATEIQTGTITAVQIQAGSITADRLTISTLSAISANLGTITAGTITGATIRTSASNPRIELDSSGLQSYNGAGTLVASIDTSFIGTIKATIFDSISGGTVIADGGGSGVLIGSGGNLVSLNTSTSVMFLSVGSGTPRLTLTSTGGSSGTAIFSGGLIPSADSMSLTNSLTVGNGQGIVNAAGTDSLALASGNPQIYASSTLVFNIATSGTQINIGGTFYTLSVDGSGFVKAA